MKKHLTLAMAGMLVLAGNCMAQNAPSAADSHKAYDQKLRDCRKSAAEQNLKGEDQRTFVANCMKAGRAS